MATITCEKCGHVQEAKAGKCASIREYGRENKGKLSFDEMVDELRKQGYKYNTIVTQLRGI